MKTKTILLVVLNGICFLNFILGQRPIDTLTQVSTTISAGGQSSLVNINNRTFTYNIGQISGRALIRPDQSYEIGFIHCNSCKIVSSNLPDLSPYIRVYPSPAKDFFAIESEYPNFLRYKLHSISGQELISGVLQDKQIIEITHLSEGLYILIFYDELEKATWFEKVSKL